MWPVSETPGPFDEQTIRDFILASDNLKTTGQERWIFFDQSKTPVGLIDLFSYNDYNLSAGIGIMIGSKANRRKGLATEAIQTLIGDLQNNARLKIIYALIYHDNLASIGLFRKCGFTEGGKKYYKGKEAIQFVLHL